MRQTIVEGRVNHTRIEFEYGMWLSVFNVHNFGIPGVSMQRVADAISAAMGAAASSPLKCLVAVLGDFNISAEPPLFSDEVPTPV
eukprot:3024946-Pyramimonas_sp.AAC.1